MIIDDWRAKFDDFRDKKMRYFRDEEINFAKYI
jgi:hypothetical protein